MSDAGEKSFEPTPHRLAKARREGNVARSGEFPANCSFAATALAVVAGAPFFGSVACAALLRSFSLIPDPYCLVVLAASLVPVACASAAGAIASLAQNGGLTLVPVSVKIERLNPADGLRRILSRETLNHSLRAALAFSCATLAAVAILNESLSAMLRSATPLQSSLVAWSAVRQVAFCAGAIGTLFSLAEYGAARSAWLRKLRMSFDERRREHKEEEGDAVARGRRRALHRALARGGVERVKQAAFVVTNPTHVAIALAYAPPRVAVPQVVARALDEAALRVRNLARKNGIPIVENASLARALYRDCRSGEPIPHLHYVAVAQIVAALYRCRELSRR